MINQEVILQKLRQGAKAWNNWRKTQENSHLSLDNIQIVGLNLDGIDLSKLSVKNAVIRKSSFRNADLISTNFSGSSLRDNDFSKAKLIATCLDNTDLSSSVLTKTNMLMASTKGIKLENIDFRGHDLSGFNLKGASLANSNLEGQDLSRMDLAHANLKETNLSKANLTKSNLTSVDLTGANLEKIIINSTIFKSANLSGNSLRKLDLQGVDFESANLANCDLRETNLSKANLTDADITGVKLWQVHTRQWNISNVTCRHAFWDKAFAEKTKYRKHEFERIYAEAITLELHYPYRLTNNELATLPIFIEHLQAVHWGIILRLKSITDVSGGALLQLVVEETGSHSPAELKASLQEEAERIQHAQLSLRTNSKLQLELKEKVATIKEEFWPRLLELAADHEHQQVRTLTVVFMDLKGFSSWGGDELSDKLSLFRGLVKPILNRWHANYPNMEGDSLRITFKNASMGLACACMVRNVLTAAGFEIRIGVELGEVAVIHNEVTDITDLEGIAVSMAARLEAIASPGEVLISHKVRQYTDHRDLFIFTPKCVKLRKSIGDMKKGHTVDCFSVTSNAPLQDIK